MDQYDILDHADDIKQRLKDEGKWPPKDTARDWYNKPCKSCGFFCRQSAKHCEQCGYLLERAEWGRDDLGRCTHCGKRGAHG
jgi:hypothetical protein